MTLNNCQLKDEFRGSQPFGWYHLKMKQCQLLTSLGKRKYCQVLHKKRETLEKGLKKQILFHEVNLCPVSWPVTFTLWPLWDPDPEVGDHRISVLVSAQMLMGRFYTNFENYRKKPVGEQCVPFIRMHFLPTHTPSAVFLVCVYLLSGPAPVSQSVCAVSWESQAEGIGAD